MSDEAVDVAVVGGGPAGALLAARVAAAGRDVVVLERQPSWVWHACGVFASPASVRELRRAGVREPTLDVVARRIPAMRVETPAGTVFRLTYGAERVGGEAPVAFDRSRLDPALIDLALAAGANVRCGATVERVDALDGGWLVRYRTAGEERRLRVPIVVGADGHRSTVARALAVDRPARLGHRVGLTWHVEDEGGDGPQDGRMVILDGAYCGLAPVPGRRLNVGIVLASPAWHERLAQDGAEAVGAEILRRIRPAADSPEGWRTGHRLEPIAGASPLGHRVTRRAGPGWLLVGDAAGFLDPFTGEGLHRALVSARIGAEAVIAALAAPDPGARDATLARYGAAMRGRFASKDLVSYVVQAFLARPALFEYASSRLARRRRVRETMGLVMGDLVPASRAIDLRYLAALLAP